MLSVFLAIAPGASASHLHPITAPRLLPGVIEKMGHFVRRSIPGFTPHDEQRPDQSSFPMLPLSTNARVDEIRQPTVYHTSKNQAVQMDASTVEMTILTRTLILTSETIIATFTAPAYLISAEAGPHTYMPTSVIYSDTDTPTGTSCYDPTSTETSFSDPVRTKISLHSTRVTCTSDFFVAEGSVTGDPYASCPWEDPFPTGPDELAQRDDHIDGDAVGDGIELADRATSVGESTEGSHFGGRSTGPAGKSSAPGWIVVLGVALATLWFGWL